MSASSSAILAAADRPLALRKRPDLQSAPVWFGGQCWTVIRDPLSERLHYLSEQEHAVWNWLDGAATWSEIQTRFEREFAPRRLSFARLQAFLRALHQRELVQADAAGQGAALQSRDEAAGWEETAGYLAKLAAPRWRGFDPRALLDFLAPLGRAIFSGWGLAVWLVLVSAAVVSFALDSPAWQRRLPAVDSYLTPANLICVWLVLALVKTLHELGHALAARRFGGDCRQWGLQWFFFLPCLYADVSPSWLLADKRSRMAIAAAGVYVELFVAAVAYFLWRYAEPGFFAAVCFQVLVAASLGTILLNGNPLLRYDGYYLLCDALEAPNLETRSREHLLTLSARHLLGVSDPGDEALGEQPRWGFALYSIAALLWRIILLVAAYLGARHLAAGWRLEPLCDLLGAVLLWSLLFPLGKRISQMFARARQTDDWRPARLIVWAGLACLALIAGCFVPLPQRVVAPVRIDPERAATVYVTAPGMLVWSAKPGTAVQAGDPLARLENLQLAQELLRLQGEHEGQSLRVEFLETRQGDPASSALLPPAQEALADLAARLAKLREQAGRLELKAPRAGVVYDPPARQRDEQAEVVGWSGSPLDAENLRAWLASGDAICRVGPADRWEATAVVEQSQVAQIRPGDPVRIVGAAPGALAGRVSEIALRGAEGAPEELRRHRLLPKVSAAGDKSLYLLRIELHAAPAALSAGQTAVASIGVRWEPLSSRLLRWLGATFRFAPRGG